MLSACWTNSWCSHVIGRTQNTLKHSGKYYFSKLTTMKFNCLPGNRRPLPLVILDDIGWHWMILDDSGTMRNLYHVSTKDNSPTNNPSGVLSVLQDLAKRASFLWGHSQEQLWVVRMTHKQTSTFIHYVHIYIYVYNYIYNYIYIYTNEYTLYVINIWYIMSNPMSKTLLPQLSW